MNPVPLVHTTRSYPDCDAFVENVHVGSIAVVDLAGKLQWFAGDPDFMTFTRSTIKPFQALPFVLDDGPARFGFSQDELALLCASHSGEEKHVRGVESILARAGCSEHELACGCHAPIFYETLNRTPPAGHQWRQVHHNCSGKHSGFLAWCRLHDVPTAGYLQRSHPLQQRIRQTLAEAAMVSPDAMPTGMDGCSAPNYALPLARLAHMFARLAQGSRDAQYGAAMGDLFDAMTARPDLVSGEGRNDLAYMTAAGGDWVTKVGADGVQVIGIRSAGLGIAIKIADGNSRAVQTATVSVLRQLGLTDGHDSTLLEPYRQPVMRNVSGLEVGDVRAVFDLVRAPA